MVIPRREISPEAEVVMGRASKRGEVDAGAEKGRINMVPVAG